MMVRERSGRNASIWVVPQEVSLVPYRWKQRMEQGFFCCPRTLGRKTLPTIAHIILFLLNVMKERLDMKNLKKLLCGALSLTMVLGLAACGGLGLGQGAAQVALA